MAKNANNTPRKQTAGFDKPAGGFRLSDSNGSFAVTPERNIEFETGTAEQPGTVAEAATDAPTAGQSARKIAGYDVINPFDVAPDTAGSPGTGSNSYYDGDRPARARRGRPAGSRNRTAAETAPGTLTAQGLKDLDSLVLIAHFTCARLLSVPELELTEEESRKLAGSLRKVAVEYAVTLNPKKLAVVELIVCAGGIYGPRAITWYGRVTRKSSPATQTPSRPVSAPPPPMPEPEPVPPPGPGTTPPPQPPPPGGVPSQLWQEEVLDGSFI